MFLPFGYISHSSQCSTTGVTKAVVCAILSGMVHLKEPLLLIGKSSLCGGSGFPFSLSEWSLTICLTFLLIACCSFRMIVLSSLDQQRFTSSLSVRLSSATGIGFHPSVWAVLELSPLLLSSPDVVALHHCTTYS